MTYRRFRAGAHPCPQCQQVGEEDHWPPNYGGGSVAYAADGCEVAGESRGSMKYVCWRCHVQWTVTTTTKYRRGGRETYVHVGNVAPMAERDGQWLTEHDVWREDYREKHGHYPSEAYG